MKSAKRVFTSLCSLLLFLGMVEALFTVLPHIVTAPMRATLDKMTRNTWGRTGGPIESPTLAQTHWVTVGSGSVYGVNVREKDNFSSRLSAMTGRKVTNLGVSGARVKQYNRLVELATLYQPNEILYFISPEDFRPGPTENIRRLNEKVARQPMAGDRMLFSDPEATGPLEQMLSAVRLLRTVQAFNVFLSSSDAGHVSWSAPFGYFSFEPVESQSAYLDWERPDVQRAANQVMGFVSEAQRYATDQGHRFQVVLLPSKEIVYGPQTGNLASRIYRESHHETLRQTAARLRDKGIAATELTPTLRQQATGGKMLFHSIDGYLSETGHETVALALKALLVDSPPSRQVSGGRGRGPTEP